MLTSRAVAISRFTRSDATRLAIAAGDPRPYPDRDPRGRLPAARRRSPLKAGDIVAPRHRRPARDRFRRATSRPRRPARRPVTTSTRSTTSRARRPSRSPPSRRSPSSATVDAIDTLFATEMTPGGAGGAARDGPAGSSARRRGRRSPASTATAGRPSGPSPPASSMPCCAPSSTTPRSPRRRRASTGAHGRRARRLRAVARRGAHPRPGRPELVVQRGADDAGARPRRGGRRADRRQDRPERGHRPQRHPADRRRHREDRRARPGHRPARTGRLRRLVRALGAARRDAARLALALPARPCGTATTSCS